MTTVLAVDESLARNVIEHLPDGGEHYDGSAADLPDNVVAVEGPRRLVEFCRDREAAVLVVGVKLGMSRYLAMDAVRDLLDPARQDRPAVVLVTHAITMALAKHATEIGVYSIVETKRPDRLRLSRIIADEVLLAKAWREGRAERASFQPLSVAQPQPPKRARASQARRRAS